LKENSSKNVMKTTEDCYGICDTCDCFCNQPCDQTTPGCYTLKSDSYKTE
jgi:hypothetical protein